MPSGCFACGGTDHWAETCPELSLPPARNHAEHMARLEKYRDWCHENDPEPGRITARQKQDLIRAENDRWAKARKGKAA